MDSLHFDGYTSYSSDSSAPRTPSPQDMHFHHSPHYKPTLDIEPRIYGEHGTIDGQDDGVVPIVPGDTQYWNTSAQPPSHFAFNNSRGSLLQELYDHDIAEQHHPPSYVEQSAEPSSHGAENWASQQQLQQQDHHRRHHDYTLIRRATFPYVRHDRDDGIPMQQQYPPFLPQHHHHDNIHSFPSRQDHIYGSPVPLTAEPTSFRGESFVPSMSASPHQSYQDFDDGPSIKLEDNTPLMVPSQTAFYRPSTSPLHNGMTMSYLSPHTGLPVQHTDDAASKETQYLRRRCFNCHTTEPPSWRRSTLNPGKIVCNKCGLYERTHLRPRPLRFDELRAGNKARKASKGTVSPKAGKLGLVKKEQREYTLVRRNSVSSSSSVHSGSGASDWDDNGVLVKTAFSPASY
jgi:GATA-binding protein, other eukaryote